MCSCWIWERFRCFLQGHRSDHLCGLRRGIAERAQSGTRYCLACDSPVWVDRQPSAAKPDPTQVWSEQ